MTEANARQGGALAPGGAPGDAPGNIDSAGIASALVESRERWRALGTIAADFAWETDATGLLTFIAPLDVLGWPATALLGQPAARLIAPMPVSAPDAAADTAPADPFMATVPVRRRPVWLSDSAGRSVCFALSSDPLRDADGVMTGTRGVGIDVTEQVTAANQAAAALRRGEILNVLLSQLRLEVQSPRVMEYILSAVQQGLGAIGTAIVNVPENLAAEVPYIVGGPVGPVLAIADQLLRSGSPALQSGQSDSGFLVLACPVSTRFGEQSGVVVWRAANARPWDDDDHTLAAAASGLIRIVLEHEAIQRQLATQARTDPLTGLLNRRAFMEETVRRIDRLDRENLPGTMLCLDIDGFTALNLGRGQEAGDSVLICAANLLRRTFRPSDLLGRIGADEFGVWLDGSDELTAAERAEDIRVSFPRSLAELPSLAGPGFVPSAIPSAIPSAVPSAMRPQQAIATLTTGIACRQPGTYEDFDSIMARTVQVLRDTRRGGPGQWRVSHARPVL